MSLFLQSMCMMGWKYAEENEKFVRLELGEGDTLVSLKVHAPYGSPVKVTFWSKGTGEFSREFESLPAIAGYTGKPDTLLTRLNAEVHPNSG